MNLTNSKQVAKHLPELTLEQRLRFRTKYQVNTETDCWEWTGQTKHGYGQFKIRKVAYAAHRVSLHLSGSELNPYLVVDHLCRNKLCVNPKHLRQVTIGENVLCGEGPPAKNARAEVCQRGHKLFHDPKRGRRCQECAKLNYQRRVILSTKT